MAEITYRDVSEDDFDGMHAVGSDWAVVRQLGAWPWPPDPDFTRTRARPYNGNGFVWAIRRDGQTIGTVAVTGEELGYALHPDHHGQGIMTRAAMRAVTAAFDDRGRTRIVAATWIDNIASVRLLRTLGFRHYQTRYERSKARGLPVITHRHRLTRVDWSALRGETE